MGSFYDFFGQPLHQCAEELKSTLSSVHFLQEKKSAECIPDGTAAFRSPQQRQKVTRDTARQLEQESVHFSNL